MKNNERIMSDSKAMVTNGWSTLNTVDQFDIGVNNSSANIIQTNDDISKSVVKSLFIESLIDQLCKLLEKDPVRRRKMYTEICGKLYELQLIEDTYNIEELASLRGHYQQALLDVMVAPDTRLCSMPCIKLGSSRYANEYEEICFIASGGFGKVFKVKNHLDQANYAVKKIQLKYQNVSTFAKKLNEVKTLAKLNHPNIVQYKAAWLEPLLSLAPSIQSPERNISSTDSDIVVFQSNNSDSTGNNKYLTQEENDNDKNMAVCKFQRGNNLPRPVPQVSALLYVVMQLCDGTLYEWINKRNLYKKPVDISLILNLISQAATGVQYIHSCNIVHHDIKPRNIFLSSDLKSVQVGDFGLACCLQGHDHSDCPLEGGQFGTPLYAAPEQLRGRCDAKSDMFSLGLVLIEMLTVFSTEMERVKVLSNARSGQLPPSLITSLVPVIENLVSHIPNKRPTATQLIETLKKFRMSEFQKTQIETGMAEICSADFVTKGKDQMIKDKDREITELKEMLAQRENEIAQLKHLIKNVSS